MSPSETETLVAQTQDKMRAEIHLVKYASWTFTAFSAVLALAIPQAEYFAVALTTGLLSVGTMAQNKRDLQDFNEHIASQTWEKLRNSQWAHREVAPATQQLEEQIRQFYLDDPRGEIFPLRQAILLLETHYHQQNRLLSIDSRLLELSELRATLALKIARLRELGDESKAAQDTLGQFDRDLNALTNVQKGLEASCHRLEMILISVDQSAQVRRLHCEISAFTAPDSGELLATPNDELLSIERQIGYEIETFLRLERETDLRFR